MQRQEVVNVLLAQQLVKRGLGASPEQVVRPTSGVNRLPDVLIDYHGLRLAIEAEYNAKTGNPETKAYSAAKGRIDEGIAQIGVAVVYPSRLKRAPFATLESLLPQATLRFAIVNEVSAPETQLHLFGMKAAQPKFLQGSIDDLVEAIRRSYEQLAQDDALARAVGLIERSVYKLMHATDAQPAALTRIAAELGVHHGRRKSMSEKECAAVARIAALVLENALLFQEVLSQHDSRVEPLERFRTAEAALRALREHWKYILDDINYYPIFSISYQVLGCFSADKAVDGALRDLASSALHIVACKAALRHDLAGRIYHRLLEEAKYLGAYYTAIPSAALLLKLALRPDRYDVEWSSGESLQAFHVADLACGTGTLLMASADAIADNYVRACVDRNVPPALDGLHKDLVAHTILGYDVLSSAVHLTAATLSLRVPATPINTTKLYQMPLGGRTRALGTLEFLERTRSAATLFSEPEQITGSGTAAVGATSIPRLDLCVMNPPFTRSVGCNLLFGNFPEKDRAPMQRRLRSLVSKGKYSASVTAGLGAVFAALGDRFVKDSGSLALVLPKTLLSGVAWKKTRDLVEKKYFVEYIVVSHEPGHWNFSENTSLSETLVVARKMGGSKKRKGQGTVFINLWRQPRTAIESLGIASQIVRHEIPPLGKGVYELCIGGSKCGEANRVDWQLVKGQIWSLPCSFAQASLNRILLQLFGGKVILPSRQRSWDIPITPLGDLASIGFDRRDIHDGFERSGGRTSFRAVWGQDSSRHMTLRIPSNCHLKPRSKPAAGRPLRDAAALWKAAGNILVPERMRLNTMRLTAAWVDRPVLANVWWTLRLKARRQQVKQGKAIIMWLNSTLGILLLLGHRSETEGAFVDFKKPVLKGLPVLDTDALTATQLNRIAKGFDKLQDKNLLPLSLIAEDDVRKKVDQAIQKALGLPDLSSLRESLSVEPLLTLSLAGILPEASGGPSSGRS